MAPETTEAREMVDKYKKGLRVDPWQLVYEELLAQRNERYITPADPLELAQEVLEEKHQATYEVVANFAAKGVDLHPQLLAEHIDRAAQKRLQDLEAGTDDMGISQTNQTIIRTLISEHKYSDKLQRVYEPRRQPLIVRERKAIVASVCLVAAVVYLGVAASHDYEPRPIVVTDPSNPRVTEFGIPSRLQAIFDSLMDNGSPTQPNSRP